jgi:hemin uptake protein HemP
MTDPPKPDIAQRLDHDLHPLRPDRIHSQPAAHHPTSSLPTDSIPLTAFPKLITSDELFGEERQVLIDHAGAVYRLQITKQGKLILTK